MKNKTNTNTTKVAIMNSYRKMHFPEHQIERLCLGFVKNKDNGVTLDIINEAITLTREEETEFLNRLSDDVDALQKDYANLDVCNKVDVIRLIEVRLKELEEANNG